MKAPLGSCGSGHRHVPRAVPVPKLQPPGPALLPALLSLPHRGHRVAQGTGTAVAGGHPSPSPCPQPPGARASSPAALPARLLPRIGATEGEIQALTRSDSSHSRDGDLGCHLAASRRGTALTARRACNPEQMAAPAPRGAPSCAPRAAGQGAAAPRGPAGAPPPPQMGLGSTEPPAVSLSHTVPGVSPEGTTAPQRAHPGPVASPRLVPARGAVRMGNTSLVTADTNEQRGKEVDPGGSTAPAILHRWEMPPAPVLLILKPH